MRSFVIPRKTNEEYNRMMEIWYWCEATFGKQTYLDNCWSAGFASYDWELSKKYPNYGDEDLVQFAFPNEAEATAFELRWL